MDTGNTGGFDASLLEGLPLNQFNWGEWNVSSESTWNRISPLRSFSGEVWGRKNADEKTYFENVNSMPLNGQPDNIGPNPNFNGDVNGGQGGQGFGRL